MPAGNADLRFDFVYRPTVRPLADLRLGRSFLLETQMLVCQIGELPENDSWARCRQIFLDLLVRISKPCCQLATSTISNDGDMYGTGDAGSRLTVRGAAM